ncbi:MAG: hypothetical protein ACYTHM_16230, partial [Planctomycetota bacterium]
EKDEGKGEEDAGGEKKGDGEEPGAEEKGGGEKPAEDSGSEKADPEKEEPENPPVKVKPYEDPDVQKEIEKKLSEKAARDYLEALLRRISETVKRLEMGIRKNPQLRRNPDPSLRSEIDFERIARKVAEDREWTRPYYHYRPRTFRETRFLSREEMRDALGAIGPRIADKAWELGRLTTSDVIAVPGGYVVFRTLEDQPEKVLPLEEIREKVLEDYRLEKALERAQEKAKEIEKRMRASSFDAVAREETLKVQETVFFRSGDGTIPGDGEHPPVGEAPNFIAAAFSPDLQGVSRPVTERDMGSVFLLHVVQKLDPSPAEMSAQDRRQFVDESRRNLWNEVNKRWGEDFKKTFKVVDYTRDRPR